MGRGGAVEWTPEEDLLLRKHYHNSETRDLEPLLEMSAKRICRRANYLGLTKSREVISRQKTRIATKNRVCKIEGCGKKHEARGFCHNHNHMFMRGTLDQDGNGEYVRHAPWSDEEEGILKREFPDNTLTALLALLPNRSGLSIKVKAGKMGIQKSADGWRRCHKEKITPEFRIKQSCAQRGIALEDFDGFITSALHRVRVSEKYKQWRDAVYVRDGFTCQICGARGNFHAHHLTRLGQLLSDYQKLYGEIDADDDYFYDVANGQTLCVDCHGKEHGRDFTTWSAKNRTSRESYRELSP